LCELSLGLELYLVSSIVSAASFRVGRNSQDIDLNQSEYSH
jgi:hypothetical protein